MRVVLFGATGMIGGGALLECLDDPAVESVLAVVRRSTGVEHRKLEEAVHADFYDYTPIRDRFSGTDGCFFCLGVSSAGKSEKDYRRLTYDLTVAAAQAIAAAAPESTLCYVSGAGTDSTGRGRVMWARVKGQTENALVRLPFKSAYMLRPGYVQPLRGVRSKTRLYQAVYAVATPIYPALRFFLPGQITTTVAMGRAMIELVANGDERHILTTAEINRVAGRRSRTG